MNEARQAKAFPTEGSIPPHPRFGEAARVWARIGLLSFGGPAGQIALMHREVVDSRRWVPEDRFLHALNYCMLLPGPEAQQLAVYVGWLLHGVRGGLVAGLLFVLPGLCLMLALSVLYALHQSTQTLVALFFGLKAAVLAIVVEALLRLGRRTLKTGFSRGVSGCAFVALFVFAVPFPVVIVVVGLMGLVVAWREGAGRAASSVAHAPSEARPETRRWGRTLLLASVWTGVWMAPLVAIVLLAGQNSVFVTIGLFFSKLAVVTFGGAYAVLSYVAQQAVETYGWLRPGEMLDGLALAETTPGPLVLTFVAFLAAFHAPLGFDPVLAGLLGGLLAAWVTFVPCFALVFLGAPSVERLRANRMAAAVLSAISAAVAGVILNLAVWFALHVLFRNVLRFEARPVVLPLPDPASFDPAALLLTLVAALLVFVLKRGPVLTLAVCAGGGLLLSMI